MKTVRQIMAETNALDNVELMKQMMAWPYEHKVRHAEEVARAFWQRNTEEGRNLHVSVGGLDSITPHYFLKEIGVLVPCISCSTLEQKGVQKVHHRIREEMEAEYAEWEHDHGALTQAEIDAIQDPARRNAEQKLLEGIPPKPAMYFLPPLKPKVQVIREFGWPVLSKEIAGKIALLQNPTADNATVRHAIITGETGEYGGWQTESRMQLSRRWLSKFGGADGEGAALGYEAAPFKVSDRCCYYLKEKPCDDWAKAHNSVPYLGLMASEGGRRQKSLMMHGCNYWVAIVHWDTDVQLIAPAVDKVLGYSCRACSYLHWWDFVGAFQNIGKGLFAQVVSIRNKRAKGQALDKSERTFARENEDLIGPVTRLTKEEEDFFRRLGV